MTYIISWAIPSVPYLGGVQSEHTGAQKGPVESLMEKMKGNKNCSCTVKMSMFLKKIQHTPENILRRLNYLFMKVYPFHTVDGRNPAPVLMVNIPVFTRLYICQVVQDFFHQQYLDFWYLRNFLDECRYLKGRAKGALPSGNDGIPSSSLCSLRKMRNVKIYNLKKIQPGRLTWCQMVPKGCQFIIP